MNDHDPHHQATSPSSSSVLFSAGTLSSKAPRGGESLEQWNEVGSSSLQPAGATSSDSDTSGAVSEAAMAIVAQTYAGHHGRGGGRHVGQEYGNGYDDEDDQSFNNCCISSSLAAAAAAGSSSSPSLSPSSSSSSDADDDDDDDYEDVDDGHEGGEGEDEEEDPGDSQENDSSSFSDRQMQRRRSKQHQQLLLQQQMQQRQQQLLDYYGGGRRHGAGVNDGLLPPAPAPAIEPLSDREALELEARQRRLERHIDKRRQSLNGSQPPPTPRRKKRKKAKDLRKQVLLKNAQYMGE
ncbi:hypothetical protein EDD21DRAFT_380930 [Dissophora ornata]|nr:hypothetical protein EDD21DRAFT_380930 [Dissophora ornata]